MNLPTKACGVLLIVTLAFSPAATCVPLFDLETLGPGAQELPTPTGLSVAVLKPSSDRTVPQGTAVEIEWTAGNLTGDDALATVLVRNREDLSEIIIAGGIRVLGTGTLQSLDWNTSDVDSGAYSVLVRIEAGGQSAEAFAPGKITLNAPPTLEFTEPLETFTFGEPTDADGDGEDDPVELSIRWTAFDPDGDGKLVLGIDPDLDHANGDEITILERDIPTSGGVDSFTWNAEAAGGRVDPGTYNLYAELSDEFSEGIFVEGPAQIVVLEVEEEPTFDQTKFEITAPAEDAEFVTGGDPLTITYAVSAPDRELLVDLSLTSDDNPSNGNEIVILSQRFLEEGTEEDSFEWSGDKADGDPVPDGIYKIVLIANAELGSPIIKTSEALVFRREFEDKPLVAVLKPDANTETDAGASITISWRDDDPTEESLIRVVIDDDELPNEAAETDGAEREILKDRKASLDGVNDSLIWSVASDLEPGRFWFFVYIDRDGVAPFDHVSVSPRPIIIPDPEAP